MLDQISDERMIEISQQNPKEVYTADDGRVIFNGAIFDNEQQFKIAMKLTQKIVKFKNFFKRKK